LTISEWTDNNYQPLKQACVRISEGNPLAEELLHYVLSEFLLKTDVHAIILSGGGFFYCLRMATNSWKSTTSPFYRNYRDPHLCVTLNEHHFQQMEETGRYDDDTKVWDDNSKSLRTKGQMNDLHPESEWNQEDLWQRVQEAMEDLGWYEQELLKVYAENGGNASLVSRLTKIPRTSINLTIRKIKRHMKQTLAKEVR
jgi:DNA-directed RNA polymerase specialized sigma24 family protein